MNSVESKKYEKNVSLLFYLRFTAGFLVIMPVIIPFFNSLGLSMKDIYILQAVFAVTVFLFEIPSGYVSDVLGRKKTLLTGFIFEGIGFSIFPLASDMTWLIVAEFILALGISLRSGTDTALIYDSLDAAKSKKASIKVLGKNISAFNFGEALAAVVTSALMYFGTTVYSISVINAILVWPCVILVFFIVEPPRLKMGNQHIQNMTYIWRGLFRQTKLLRMIIYNSIFSFSGTLMAVWLFQKYWQNIEIPIVYFGLLWALTNLSAAFSSQKAHKVEKLLGSPGIVIFIGLAPVAAYFGIAFIDHFIGVLACVLIQVDRGFGQVIFKDGLNKRVTADFRATANSVTQMGVRIFFAVAGPILGWGIDRYGMTRSTFVLGVFYIFIFIFVVLPLLRLRSEYDPIPPKVVS